MKSKQLLLPLFLLVLFVANIAAQATNSEVLSRLEQLEQKEELLKEKIDQNLKSAELKIEETMNSKKKALDNDLLEVQGKFKEFGIYLSMIGIGSLLGLVGIWFALKKWVEAQYQTKLGTLIKDKRVEFEAMIASQDLENQIRKTEQFLVLSTAGNKKTKLDELLHTLNIDNTSSHLIQDKSEVPATALTGDAIVIINDLDGNFDREILTDILDRADNKSLFLGFATGKERLPSDPRMNFTNSKFTFYHNLINLAKYRRLVGKNNVA